MSYSSRFWLYAPLCLLLALAAWAGAHWWSVATAFDRKLDALKGREAVPGIVIDWQNKSLSGFPFRLDVVFDRLKVRGSGARGPFEWHSEKFALHALTYGQQKQVLEAGGRQYLAWTGEDGGAHHLEFLPAALHASAIFVRGSLARFDLDILDTGGKDTGGDLFTAGRLQLHLRRDPDHQGLDLEASGDAVKNAAGMPPFGTVIPAIQVYCEIVPGAAFASLLRGESSWPQAHADWLKHGGTVKFQPPQAGDAERATVFRSLLSPLY